MVRDPVSTLQKEMDWEPQYMVGISSEYKDPGSCPYSIPTIFLGFPILGVSMKVLLN